MFLTLISEKWGMGNAARWRRCIRLVASNCPENAVGKSKKNFAVARKSFKSVCVNL